jgi:hypothetical protein
MQNPTFFENMRLNARAWYYLTARRWNQQLDLPPDVKNFILRRALRRIHSVNRELTPKEQDELATLEMNALLLNEPGTLESDTMNELVGDAIGRLGKIPLEHCSRCSRPVFQYKATKTDTGYLCEDCAAESLSGGRGDKK